MCISCPQVIKVGRWVHGAQGAINIEGSDFGLEIQALRQNNLEDIPCSDVFRGALDGYVSKARKVSGKRSSSRKASSPIDNKTIRAWAASNGIQLSKRGRIPQDVVSQFRAAGN